MTYQTRESYAICGCLYLKNVINFNKFNLPAGDSMMRIDTACKNFSRLFVI